MRLLICILIMLLAGTGSIAQKKPLDHSVYDGWQSIGERKISPNGQWVAYTIDVQEGDGQLVIQSSDAVKKAVIPRGYAVTISRDNSFAVFLIRPSYTSVREARIKKKKPEDMPRDSLGILFLGTDSIVRMGNVKSYRLPEDAARPLAFQKYKAADSTLKTPAPEGWDEGSDLLILDPGNGAGRTFPNISEMKWSRNGKLLVMEYRASRALPGSRNGVLVYRAVEDRADTISRGGNEFSQFEADEQAYQVAYLAERDSSAKSLTKFYHLWYWRNGMDSAVSLVETFTPGMKLGWTVSPNGRVFFSKSGSRLFFGTAPIRPPKDTSLVEMDQVKLDVWHYNDDYLQTQQLKNLDRELRRSYAAMYDLNWKKTVQLADELVPEVLLPVDGDGPRFLGITDVGKRISLQWEGKTRKDIISIDAETGSRRSIRKDVYCTPMISPEGKYIYWYDEKARQYFACRDTAVKNISAKLTARLYDEQNDLPDDPAGYGVCKWIKGDGALLVYDRYDIWQLDPEGIGEPVCITGGKGRREHTVYRYSSLDPDEKALEPGQDLILRTFNDENKQSGLARLKLYSRMLPADIMKGEWATGTPVKAAGTNVIVYTKETFRQSPDLYARGDDGRETRLSAINPQQADFNWGTVELFKWKAYDGSMATGMVFKPENFNPSARYPLICYFYERLSDSLFRYRPPAPVRSRIDISFFVSRGYMVFVPDIRYKTGYPGKGAYDYVVSGARELVRRKWADSARIGIQGQSWGGYQVAYLVTRTKLFAAAWAGAPVANMTSAYGGIRWESGLNRQMQYEKQQSRIGATLWEKPQLYIDNSPLFSVPKITTPLVIMSNDDDGAVPWYQGIELFTAMRRNGKKVWLLNYNGEKHNLEERKNKKDLSIREQQFFDWLLKGEKPTRWITEGIPATEKGRTWGLD